MDIHTLLSPSDSTAAGGASPATASPPKLAQGPTSAPTTRSSPHQLHFDSQTTQSPSRTQMPSPPINEFPHRMQRTASTSGMDTLADLAAMQHHQNTVRANSSGRRSNEPNEGPQAPAGSIRPSLRAIARTHSGSRSSLDIRMADVPAQTPPLRTFTAPSLTEEQRQRVAYLGADLRENAHAYDAHVELLRLLYHGFISHVYPTSATLQENDPLKYELLSELRQALEAMSSRFALGEELWQIRLRTMQLTGSSADDCVSLLEYYEKAVVECPASTTIWSMYAEWSLSLYCTVQDADSRTIALSRPHDMPLQISDEDKEVLVAVFTPVQMMNVWSRGADDTKFRIDKSYQLWDKWLDLQLISLDQTPSPEATEAMRSLFVNRLAVPHRTWEDTFQQFSNFISKHDNANYEQTMVAINRQGNIAKDTYAEREARELTLQRATDIGDTAAEWATFNEYIEWELSRSRDRGSFSFDLSHALLQRFLLRFPSSVDAWEDYVTFLEEEISPQRRSEVQLGVMDRACNHCPWSGTLWSLYIQTAEAAKLDFADVGQIKHKATSTGLLDLGSMEEVLKIYTAWCGFLRRRSFREESTDEELDIAEMGIRSAIEDTETLGKEKYGGDFKGDPQYRLERIYVKFLVQTRNYRGARDTWKKLISRHGDSYEFWLRYYAWEMLMWGMTINPEASSAARQTPIDATAVLRQSIQRTNMDWPEKVIETYLSHCEDHGNVEELQTAILQCRKAAKLVNKRREREARQQVSAAEEQQAAGGTEASQTSAKRKREGEESNDAASKKTKALEEGNASKALETNQQKKRDRENTTVIVRNLPGSASERHVRHYFHDCGTIRNIQLQQKDNVTTATIEFETKDDALSAQTKDQKLYNDNIITVQIGTDTTLYVTNFPPTADEGYIRKLFGGYGEIIDVRLPSLKYDTHRRFCYVQFSTAEQASAASAALDGSTVGENLTLLAKISDPAHKQERRGAMHEGREVYVGNLDWSASEGDLEKLFGKYGIVEKVRLPRKVDGKSKGMAFVTFATKDEASASLDLDSIKFKSRILSVSLATSNPGTKRMAIVHGNRTQTSPHPDSSTDQAFEKISARTISLLDVPDTVNSARLQALAETHGPVVKVFLRPDRAGALIEYGTVADAGKAALALEGAELDGARLHVGAPDELRTHRPEKSASNEQHTGSKAAPPTMLPRRAGLGAGRRGGLGMKRGGAIAAAPEKGAQRNGSGANGEEEGKPNGTQTQEKEKEKGAKSNADFKALFVAAKSAPAEKKQEGH